MLVLCIEYLNGWAMAAVIGDRQRAEWPPHPDRFFMALAAAHFESDGDQSERAALEWLERQPPPSILASGEVSHRTPVTSFVPVNDDRAPGYMDKGVFKPYMPSGSCSLGRNRQPRTFPVAIPAEPVVRFVWEEAAFDDATVSAALEKLCRKVTCVGHSASLVRCWLETSIPQEHNLAKYVARSGPARHRLRIFGSGRLSQLERLCNRAAVEDYAQLTTQQETRQAEAKQASGGTKRQLNKQAKDLKKELEMRYPVAPQSLKPTPTLWSGYDEPRKEEPGPEVARTKFSRDLLVFRIKSRQRFGLESTQLLCNTMRWAVMSNCSNPVPEWVSGHTPDGKPSQKPHLAFLPFAHVGRPHADGHLLGLAVAVPEEVQDDSGEVLSGVLFDDGGQPKLIRLFGNGYPEQQRTFDADLYLEEDDTPPLALRSETWTGRLGDLKNAESPVGRRWATVTPIVLDRHPKSSDSNDYWTQAEQTVRTACERVFDEANRPQVEEVILGPVSMFEGVPHARRFPNMKRNTGGNLHHTHAVIVFDRKVCGPLMLGAGRYRGYGFCRPLDTREERT